MHESMLLSRTRTHETCYWHAAHVHLPEILLFAMPACMQALIDALRATSFDISHCTIYGNCKVRRRVHTEAHLNSSERDAKGNKDDGDPQLPVENEALLHAGDALDEHREGVAGNDQIGHAGAQAAALQMGRSDVILL